jgi:two-component system nitrogen regulation response regulator GlnG
MLTETPLNCSEHDALAGARSEAVSFLYEIMGSSSHIARICGQVKLVASSSLTVVICGETGTGKEVIANALHRASPHNTGPFVPLDCGAISSTLLESELFGHEKGAFTGANQMKLGKFEIAAGGTLFLDEISNLPLDLQPKLLRTLQEKQIFRVGGTKPIAVNPRVIVATNDDLRILVQMGKFRRDLYHRLNEFNIMIPPLRNRKEDIEYLATRFLNIAGQEMNKSIALSASALQMLLAYSWPGNVRELRNAIRGAVLAAETEILPEHLYLTDHCPPTEFPRPDPGTQFDGSFSLKEVVHYTVAKVERSVLIQALKQTQGNKAKAARLLKVDYKTLHGKVKNYGITFASGERQCDIANDIEGG